jgi:hypothetical protein
LALFVDAFFLDEKNMHSTKKPRKRGFLNFQNMSTDRSPDPYENAGTYEARYEITKPSAKGYAKEAENKARNSSADNTQNDIHEYAGIAIHEVGCDPACKATNDNCCYPAYTCVTHFSAPCLTRYLTICIRALFRQGALANANMFSSNGSMAVSFAISWRLDL